MSPLEETGEVRLPLTSPVDLQALAIEFSSALSQRFENVRSNANSVEAENKSLNAMVFRGPARTHPLLPFDRVSIELSETERQLHIRYTLSTRVQALVYSIGIPIIALFAYVTGSAADSLMAFAFGSAAWLFSVLSFNPRGTEWISSTARTALLDTPIGGVAPTAV